MKNINPLVIVLVVSTIFLLALVLEARPETIYYSKQGCCVIKVIENDQDTDLIVYNDLTIDYLEAHLLEKENVIHEIEDYFLYCKNNHVNSEDISQMLK